MRKPKSDFPPLLMEKSAGKLAPASAFDEERFDTFANGKMWVVISQETPPKLIRTWWAVLNKVVNTCPCPWKTPEQASAALKLAAGHVVSYKTIGDQWRADPKSLHEFNSEKEAWDFFQFAMEILERVTGVPKDELIRHIPDTGDDESDSPGLPARNPGDEGGDGPISPDPALDNSAGEAGTGGDDNRDVQSSPPNNSSLADVTAECIDKFFYLATLEDHTPEQRHGLIEKVKDNWKDKLPDHPAFVKEVIATAVKVLKDEQKIDTARRYLDGLRDEIVNTHGEAA